MRISHPCAAQALKVEAAARHSRKAGTVTPDPEYRRDDDPYGAKRMRGPIKALLADGADPASVPVVALFRALRLNEAEYAAAAANARRPSADALSSVPRVLAADECAALRAAVDAESTTSRDTVDGGPDHQLTLTPAKLAVVLGARATSALFALPNDPQLGAPSCFVRKYNRKQRPWIPFHNDSADVTCNVSLSKHPDASLLVVCDNAVRRVHRDEGDATLHSSDLLHGVSAVPPKQTRYSLILFFRRK